MNKNLIKCHYCGTEDLDKYILNQKFCSSRCALHDCYEKSKTRMTKNAQLEKVSKKDKKNSISEIGKGAIANMITDFGNAVLISNEMEPETKETLRRIIKI